MSKRLHYRNPPVHEVILDLQFEGALPAQALQDLPSRVGHSLGEAKPITRISTHVLAGSRSATHRPPQTAFWGWEFFQEQPQRQVTVSANQITQHFQRSEGWPRDEYIGWEANAEAFVTLVSSVRGLFESQRIRRAGLRYVNRIAVPRSIMLEEWFSVAPTPLSVFEDVWDFNVSRTWERAPGFPGLSGTVTLGKIEIPPDDQPDEAALGVQLDVDIFNLWVRDAPQFSEVPEWIERAHSLENKVFKACIKKPLAHRFGLVK